MTKKEPLYPHVPKSKSKSEYPRMTIPEPLATQVRVELRKIPTWKLLEAYHALKGGTETGVEILDTNRAQALSAVREMLYERGKDLSLEIEVSRSMTSGSPLETYKLEGESKGGPLYPHVPKGKLKVGGGIVMFTPTKSEQLIEVLLEVSEQLAYAYQNAIYGYTKDALTHVQIAKTELSKLGLDIEDLEPVIEPLASLIQSMHGTQMASYINDAQEELKRYGPGWTR